MFEEVVVARCFATGLTSFPRGTHLPKGLLEWLRFAPTSDEAFNLQLSALGMKVCVIPTGYDRCISCVLRMFLV